MDASPPSEQRNRRETWQLRLRLLQRLPLTMMVTCLLLLLGSVQLVFQLGNNQYRTWIWTKETRDTQGRVAELQRQLHILKAAEQAAGTSEYMQTLARCQGFVLAGETLVVATQAPEAPSENCNLQRLP